MSAPAASHSDDAALLRIEGPIATITLNRPAAFNSINLAIAQKLEKLAAEIEAAPSAPAATCRRSAPRRRPTRSRRSWANC
jgi:enoyl-CoA hydratase/carnithine racemase